MGGYNQAINRFLKDSIPLIDKRQIVLYTIYYKYVVLALFLMILYSLSFFDVMALLINEYSSIQDVVDKYFVVMILSTILSILLGVTGQILTALQYYKISNNSLIVKNILYFVSVSFLIFITDEYIVFLYASLFLNTILFIYLSYKLKEKAFEYTIYSLIFEKLDISIYKRYLLSYATPLTLISLLTYVKNHLPIIILGKEFELQDVAIFSILKKLFKTLHTITGSFLQPMLSKFIELKNESENQFEHLYNKMYSLTLLLRVVIYVIGVYLSDYFFIIYNINITNINSLVFYILGLEFVIAGTMLMYGTKLNMEKSTKYLLYTSGLRFIIELLLIYILLLNYGIIGAALVLLLSRYIEVLAAYYFVRTHTLVILSFIPVVLYFIGSVVL